MRAAAQQEQAPTLEVAALTRLALVQAQHSFDTAAALATLDTAAELTRRHGDRTLEAKTAWNQAQIATVSGQIEQAVSAGERALALAEALEQIELIARSRYVLSQAHSYAGRWAEVVTLATAAHAGYATLTTDTPATPATTAHIWNGAVASLALQIQAMTASCLWQQAQGEIHIGQLREALAHAQQALALGQAIRNEWVQVAGQINIAYAAAQLGLLDQARRAATKGLIPARGLPNPAIRFWMLITHNAALLACADYAAVAATIAEAVVLAEELGGTPLYCVAALAERCTLRMLTGDQAGATADALALAPLRAGLATPLAFWDFARHHEIAALVQGGHVGLARQATEELTAAAGENRRFRLVALRMAADLAAYEQYNDESSQLLAEARELAESMKLSSEAW